MAQSGSIRYISELVESHNSWNRQYRGWLAGHGRGRSPQHLTELTILWMASTVMGEVGAHNIGHAPWPRGSLVVALTVPPTGFAVGSNEHSLCIFRQLAYYRLTIDKYTDLPSSDAVSDRVCR